MRKNDYLVNILLAVLMTLAVLGILITRILNPWAVIPAWNLPNLIILCTAALVIAEYLNPGARYSWLMSALLAGLTISLFPFIAGIVTAETVWKLLIAGFFSYLGCERMFRSIGDRLSSGPAGKLAPLSAGLTMCLIGQILSGIFL